MNRRPLASIAIAFAAGVLLCGCSPSANPVILVLLLALCLPCAAASAASRKPAVLTITLLVLAATLGFARCRTASIVSSADISRLAPAKMSITGTIQSEPQETYAGENARFLRVKFALGQLRVSGEQTDQDVDGVAEVSLPVTVRGEAYSGHVWPQYGDELHVSGALEVPAGPRNPGSFDQRAYLARRGIHCELMVFTPADWQPVGEPQLSILRPIFRLKRALLEHGRRTLSRERTGVLNAVLIGSKSDLSPTDRARFEKTGTIHLLATAGLHVGLVVAVLRFGLPYLGLRRRPAAMAALVLLALYAVMAGDRPAVMRASLMAGIYLVGLILEREPDITNTISLAALVLLMVNPTDLFDFGFQISFATVITLAAAGSALAPMLRLQTPRRRTQSPTRRALQRVFTYIADCAGITIVAQIGCLPLILYYFNIFTPAGVVANVLIIPVVAPLMVLGFAATALGAISPIASMPLDWIINGILRYILAVERLFAGPAGGVTNVASPPPWAVVLYYAVLWSLLAWRCFRKTKKSTTE